MELSKAIEILLDLTDWDLTHFNLDSKEALELGIEALKRVHLWRLPETIFTERLLPGETKE